MPGLPIHPAEWVFDANRDPPVYTRPLVGSELVMQRYWDTYDGDNEVCMGVDFSSPLGAEELRDRTQEALNKFRFLCPIIACTVEDVASPRWIYTPSADRRAWLNLAFAVEERGASLNSSDFVERIKLTRLPYTDGNGATTLFRVYLLTTSKEGDNHKQYGLYFHGSHSIVDAGPTLHALNLMFEWISDEGMEVKVKASEEWKNLPVDPISATGGPSNEWDTVGARLVQDFKEGYARTTPCHTLPPPVRPLNRAEPQLRYTTSISQSNTAAIVAQTKKLGVSVSALFHAAHSLAQFKMNPIPEATTEVDFSAPFFIVSLERYMKPPIDPRTHFVSALTSIPSRFSMAQPLMEHSERGRLISTARLLQERFEKYLVNPCLPQLLVVLASVSPTNTRQSDNNMSSGGTQAKKAPLSPWTCAFNNVGVIEKKLRAQHGQTALENVCIGVRFQTHMSVHMWTIHSKFHFVVQGATAWGEECIKTLLDETLRIASLVLDEP